MILNYLNLNLFNRLYILKSKRRPALSGDIYIYIYIYINSILFVFL